MSPPPFASLDIAIVLQQRRLAGTPTAHVEPADQAPAAPNDDGANASSGGPPRAMRILIVDDQRGARRLLVQILKSSMSDLELFEAKTLHEALESVEATRPDLVLLDIRLSPDPDELGGLEFLKYAKGRHPKMPIVVVSSSSEFEVLRQAMGLGAKAYVLKDELGPEMLVPVVEGFRERMDLRKEVDRLRRRVDREWGLDAIVGVSPAIERVRELVRRVAESDATVLVRGPTGAGKELVARALHHTSPRAAQPFVAINCSALPPTLMESIMFGHERGAFTGAVTRMAGQFELARGGTILLDEVAEMPLELQAKLLRVLEDRCFRPLGSVREIPLEARVVASTHVDLDRQLAEKKFRDDLYFRLNVVSIDVPPLIDRREDVPVLVYAFCAELPRKVHFTGDAIAWLEMQEWPGNVRELRNAIERASLLSVSNSIRASTLESLAIGRKALDAAELDQIAQIDDLVGKVLTGPGRIGNKLDAIERTVLARALKVCGGNQSAAARLLGMPRKLFWRHWNKLGELPGVGGAPEDEDDDDDDAD